MRSEINYRRVILANFEIDRTFETSNKLFIFNLEPVAVFIS